MFSSFFDPSVFGSTTIRTKGRCIKIHKKKVQAVFCYVENERIVAVFRRSLDLRHK